MFKKLISSIVLTAIVLTGCKSTPPPVKAIEVTLPSIGAQSETYLGETLIVHGLGYYANTVTVGDLNAYSAVIQGAKFYNKAGTNKYEAKTNVVTVNNGYGNPIGTQNWVIFNSEKVEVCVDDWSLNCFDKSAVNIEQGTKQELVFKDNGLQQRIIYDGKDGNTLKFTYREFMNDMARSAFTANFTMDLTESDTIGYKGARFQIHKATNNSIKYTIIKPFN